MVRMVGTEVRHRVAGEIGSLQSRDGNSFECRELYSSGPRTSCTVFTVRAQKKETNTETCGLVGHEESEALQTSERKWLWMVTSATT